MHYFQITIHARTPMTIHKIDSSTRRPDPYIDQLNLRSEQVTLASQSLHEFKFHPDVDVKNMEYWSVRSFDQIDSFKRKIIATISNDGSHKSEVIKLAYNVQFKAGTTEIISSYVRFPDGKEYPTYKKSQSNALSLEPQTELSAPARRLRP